MSGLSNLTKYPTLSGAEVPTRVSHWEIYEQGNWVFKDFEVCKHTAWLQLSLPNLSNVSGGGVTGRVAARRILHLSLVRLNDRGLFRKDFQCKIRRTATSCMSLMKVGLVLSSVLNVLLAARTTWGPVCIVLYFLGDEMGARKAAVHFLANMIWSTFVLADFVFFWPVLRLFTRERALQSLIFRLVWMEALWWWWSCSPCGGTADHAHFTRSSHRSRRNFGIVECWAQDPSNSFFWHVAGESWANFVFGWWNTLPLSYWRLYLFEVSAL